MDGKTLTLGVSGYLYRSAVLFHDDETETFWSQMTGEAIVGPLTGKRLTWMPSEVMTWKEWRTKHPETTVLKPVRALGNYTETNRYYQLYRRGDRISAQRQRRGVPGHKDPDAHASGSRN